MTWEQLLSALQAMLGRDVGASVTAEDAEIRLGFRPIGMMMLRGVLTRGEPNPLAYPVHRSDDEVLTFYVRVPRAENDERDESDDPQINLTRSRFGKAGTIAGPDGKAVAIYVVQDGLRLTVADLEKITATS